MTDNAPDSYISLSCEGKSSEMIVDRSKFYGYAFPAFDQEQARACIQRVQQEHPLASCICYAYMCGYGNSVQKYHDGHEPIGGKPILNTLKNHDLIGATCVVARYFGGTKLGVGGLARAFAGAANEAVNDANPMLYEKGSRLSIRYSYEYNDKVQYYISNTTAKIVETNYSESIQMVLEIKDRQKQEILDRINAITNSRYQQDIVEQIYIC